MAEQLDSFSFTSGPSRYNWDEWLDGSVWQLTQGEDFTAKPHSIVTTAKKQAEKRGKSLKSQIEGNTVVIQAV